MAILVNPGGRLVQVDDPKEVENFLKMPGFTLANEIQASFVLSEGTLVRAVWFHLSNQEKRLMLVIHHLVVDVFSWRILITDLHTAMKQLIAGEELQLGTKTTSFIQWSETLQSYSLSNEVQNQLPYWENQIAASVQPIKTDYAVTVASYESVVTLTRSLPAKLTTSLP